MTKSSSAKSQIAGEEAVKMLSHDNVYVGGTDCTTNHSLADRVRSTSSPRRIPLFESTSSKWWNPQFVSTNLETQYWKISFPLLRDRFRLGLIYIMLTSTLWMTYLRIFQQDSLMNWLVFTGLILLCIGMLHFACNSDHYQRFYLPTSFLSSFLIYIITLLIFSQHTGSFMGPMATLTTSTQVILLVYTVIPLPLYVCIIFNILYSFLFELITIQNQSFGFVEVPSYIRMAAHFCVHCLGIHLYILTQIRQRKTFLTVGLSLLIHDDLNRETKFKNNMILSVMPENMAEDLVKDAGELRRPSQSADSAYRMSNATTVRSSAGEGVPGSVNPSFGQVNDVRKFRPFTMNLMDEVTIVFADVAGFTKMSSNKSADELVSLLNDLFGRFDYLCSKLGCEKISTLGDCYYSVCGCPIPNKNHANKCIELGLAMIIAIRQFDIDRKQEVNMRIGVHSGKVMCGMVGTKRFKFDVFSNDVTLANEMESTGIAGRVHISETTAKFLDTRYKLDEGPVHQSLKTYFIAGRSKELEDEVAAELKTDSLLGLGPEAGGSITKGAIEPNKSFRRKVHNKMKAIAHSSSTRGSPNSQLGGSFKFRELEQDMQLQTTSNLNVSGDTEVVISSGRRKSSSLMALGKTSFSMSCPEKDQFMDDEDETAVVARRIGGKISMDLAHESSINNSLRGSRSSGLQDLGSEALSVAALDNAISHHHNAASITRYDAECKDTAEKIAQLFVQRERDSDRDGSDKENKNKPKIKKGDGFWMHEDSLNRWTLKFVESSIEDEYRSHFAEGYKKKCQDNSSRKGSNRKLILDAEDRNDQSTSKLKYSALFVDLAICAMIFVISKIVILLNFNTSTTTLYIYTALATIFLIVIICLIGMPILSTQLFIPELHHWHLRHILGLLLIALPFGMALFILPFCSNTDTPDSICNPIASIRQRLVFSFVILTVIYAHCNFSQLSCWPKTLQAIVIAVMFIVVTVMCQNNLNDIIEQNNTSQKFGTFNDTIQCNTTQPNWAYEHFGSPLFVWELVVDVTLAVILVAFLNYQYEAGFRMSFYGDVQAKRDTQKMQHVKDQADWLLTNIIPPHVVETMRLETKYSENHNMVAVIFASITNWNEMYEENFEGGREFIRVLNEIMGDFDDLLDRPEFCHIEKIKTIGSTYMAASGLNPDRRRLSLHPYEHLYQLMEFALSLQSVLNDFNEDLLNFDFIVKFGYNIGPVTAAVLGNSKLYYDILGDTVNIASRMYSTGVENRIQVSEHTKDLLVDRYDFEFRDHIEVKGVDAGMDTFLLVGRKGELPLYPPLAPK